MAAARLGLAAAGLLALVLPVAAAATDAQFPSEGCRPGSRFDPCRSRIPAPVGDPTDGSLTKALRTGPLDPPEDPLGVDAPLFVPRDPLLSPAKDRLGAGPKDKLGVGR